MRILAIESSGQRGSLALHTADADTLQTVSQTTLASDRRTAQSLAPALKSLLADAHWPPDSINLVAVAIGPGSFTGLRIGVTTAKTFAYATGAEIIGVNTLEVLAHQANVPQAPLWTIMDAQRSELFAACFNIGNSAETKIITQEAWLATLKPGDFVTGPAVRRIQARLPTGITITADSTHQPKAEAVGYVAWRVYNNGHRDKLWQLVPHYYRQSAAEEKANQRHNNPT